MPIADINTTIDVLPLLIKGKGRPVGGISPVNISYCITKLDIVFLL